MAGEIRFQLGRQAVAIPTNDVRWLDTSLTTSAVESLREQLSALVEADGGDVKLTAAECSELRHILSHRQTTAGETLPPGIARLRDALMHEPDPTD